MVLKEETADREKEAEGEKPRAQIFFIAYTLNTSEGDPRRPLMIMFNGGPGAASIYLHMGAFSPKRARLRDDARLRRGWHWVRAVRDSCVSC